MLPNIALNDRSVCFGTWRNVSLLVTSGGWTNESIAMFGEHYPQFVKAHPEGVACFTVIEASTPAPSSAQRKRIAEIYGADRQHTICSSLVVNGHGLQASLFRGVLAGMMRFSRPNYPIKVFSNVDKGLNFLLTHTDLPGVDLSKAQQIVQKFRGRFERGFGPRMLSPNLRF